MTVVADMPVILVDHASRYPLWCVDDLYKLIHQSAMGSEHALTEEGRAQERLIRELEEMGQGPDEPLLDPISPDGLVLRVHLRPLVRRGLDPELLLNAFVRTAQEFHGSQRLLEARQEAAVRLARQGMLDLDVDEIFTFFSRMRANGFPAVHHSRAYQEHYRPAYRVIALAYLPAAFGESA
jgi:hypothetical protein